MPTKISTQLGVGIIGCGLIGRKRAQALGRARLVACADVSLAAAKTLASSSEGATAVESWKELITRSDVAVVIVATPHQSLAEITLAAIEQGKHVLVEKPAAREASELTKVLKAAEAQRVCVRVGFNHRYHRAFRKAKQLITEGGVGSLMYVRARYGHGGRLGYEKEWRAQKEISGGGELIDQGVHLIDLSRWFLGDFQTVQGFASTYFWKMKVEDNGFMLLRTKDGKAAHLHASCTEWKNLFCFEIFGTTGKLEINGLGGSYGVERLTYYKMLPEMGPPETTSWEFPQGDDSWAVEFNEFLEDIEMKRQPSANVNDAIASLRIVEQIYSQSEGLSR